MNLGLCMVVKDEERVISRCLENIYDVFDSITIVDTGSTDATKDILTQKFGITPIVWDEANQPPHKKSWEPHARNLYLTSSPSEWVLVLDADEVISRQDVLEIKALSPHTDGYFIKWINQSQSLTYDDYKLVLFRRVVVEYHAFIHCTAQSSFRMKNLATEWLDGVHIQHIQDPRKADLSSKLERLRDLVNTYPYHNRYKWFLGYTYLQKADMDNAIRCLTAIKATENEMYPVECINAHVVLASIYAQQGNVAECKKTIDQAVMLYNAYSNDFEVKVNQWMHPWLEFASRSADDSNLDQIKAPEFAC